MVEKLNTQAPLKSHWKVRHSCAQRSCYEAEKEKRVLEGAPSFKIEKDHQGMLVPWVGRVHPRMMALGLWLTEAREQTTENWGRLRRNTIKSTTMMEPHIDQNDLRTKLDGLLYYHMWGRRKTKRPKKELDFLPVFNCNPLHGES